MKWLILIVLILIMFAIIAARYRRQIQAALQIWQMFRQFKQAAKPKEENVEKREIDKNVPLVRCARCGKWISQTNALDLRSKTFYCSTDCMEKTARIESLVDRT